VKWQYAILVRLRQQLLNRDIDAVQYARRVFLVMSEGYGR
jgi:hypothetical protein